MHTKSHIDFKQTARVKTYEATGSLAFGKSKRWTREIIGGAAETGFHAWARLYIETVLREQLGAVCCFLFRDKLWTYVGLKTRRGCMFKQ